MESQTNNCARHIEAFLKHNVKQENLKLLFGQPDHYLLHPTPFYKLVKIHLSSLGHAFSLHTFELGAHASFLDLTLDLLLRVLKLTPVAKIHQVTGLVDLTLEATEGRLNGFAIANGDPDVDIQFRNGAG
jgi:hypothetical protein